MKTLVVVPTYNERENLETVVTAIMGLDIAFDHRMIDGDHAGRFLTDVAKNLENFDFSQIG